MAEVKAQELEHALLGASSSERWIACPPSARLTENIVEASSGYADEGTLAHTICENRLSLWAGKVEKKDASKELTKLKKRKLFKPEMLDCSEQYVNYIKEYCISLDGATHIAVEQKIDFSDIVPGGFGTADCIIVSTDTLHLVDYKHGAGKAVSAYDNAQLKLYAAGAIRAYKGLYNITNIRLSVVQPRNDIGITHYDTTVEKLNQWLEEVVKPAATLAWAGEGDFKIGDHCQFCKAAATCRHRADTNINALTEEQAKVDPGLLTKKELYDYSKRLADLKTYANKLEAHIKKELYQGVTIPGFKLVAGRQTRVFKSDAFKKIMEAKLQPEALLYEQKPITVSALEKIVGKKDFSDNYGEYIRTETGSPAVADENSKKPAITMAQNEFKEFTKN